MLAPAADTAGMYLVPRHTTSGGDGRRRARADRGWATALLREPTTNQSRTTADCFRPLATTSTVVSPGAATASTVLTSASARLLDPHEIAGHKIDSASPTTTPRDHFFAGRRDQLPPGHPGLLHHALRLCAGRQGHLHPPPLWGRLPRRRDAVGRHDGGRQAIPARGQERSQRQRLPAELTRAHTNLPLASQLHAFRHESSPTSPELPDHQPHSRRTRLEPRADQVRTQGTKPGVHGPNYSPCPTWSMPRPWEWATGSGSSEVWAGEGSRSTRLPHDLEGGHRRVEPFEP